MRPFPSYLQTCYVYHQHYTARRDLAGSVDQCDHAGRGKLLSPRHNWRWPPHSCTAVGTRRRNIPTNSLQNKTVFSRLRAALNVTLSACICCCGPVLRRRCCWAHAARRCRSISPTGGAPGSKPAAHKSCRRSMAQTDRLTDRRTDTRQLQRPCSAYYSNSVK